MTDKQYHTIMFWVAMMFSFMAEYHGDKVMGVIMLILAISYWFISDGVRLIEWISRKLR